MRRRKSPPLWINRVLAVFVFWEAAVFCYPQLIPEASGISGSVGSPLAMMDPDDIIGEGGQLMVISFGGVLAAMLIAALLSLCISSIFRGQRWTERRIPILWALIAGIAVGLLWGVGVAHGGGRYEPL
jgi:hypothetical protein